MKIAIVILNWNGQKLLKQFLPDVIKYSNRKDTEVYIIDNASTDSSVTFVKSNFPEVTCIENAQNMGYAGGYNLGLKEIEADLFCLLNSDVAVSENWLNPIVKVFKENPNTGIVQPKILDFKKPSHFEYAGAGGGFIDTFGYPYCRGRLFDTLETDSGQYNDIYPIFWASGACFFIRAVQFKALNGFDEDFFAHYEEIDLCWRSKSLNIDCTYVGESTVFHVGGATLNEVSATKTYYNFRNSLYAMVKNLPDSVAFQRIIMRLSLDGLAGIKFLIDGKPKHTWAIIHAHFSFYKMLPKMTKKRVNTGITKSYSNIKSIVWAYFIQGKKTYRDL